MSSDKPPPRAKVEIPLDRNPLSGRALFDSTMTVLTVACTVLAVIPLFSVLYMLFRRGAERLSLAVFTELPPAALQQGGGIGNAIVGTLLMVGLASLLSVPLGLLVAIYLAEFGGNGKTAGFIRFCAKVLTGVPSILAGVFAFAVIVLTTRQYSAYAGSLALSILMLPTVILTAEEALRMVPRRMREAAFGLGCTPTQVVWKVVVPTALPGILTGVMLAVARAAGETAPLLFTAKFSEQWNASPNEPTASLAVLIYNFSQVPYPNQVELAWTAALVLVFLVLTINILAQIITRRTSTHTQR